MKKKTIIIIVVVVCLVIFGGIVIAGTSGLLDEETTTAPSQTTESTSNEITAETTKSRDILYGELLDVVDNYDIDKTVVIKAKIKPSYSNKTTIDQNYYSIADFIRNKGYDKYSEIQYWAVADMNDGSEQKVISFTLNSETIQKIQNNEIVDNQIGTYTEDLWVHPSLEN